MARMVRPLPADTGKLTKRATEPGPLFLKVLEK